MAPQSAPAAKHADLPPGSPVRLSHHAPAGWPCCETAPERSRREWPGAVRRPFFRARHAVLPGRIDGFSARGAHQGLLFPGEPGGHRKDDAVSPVQGRESNPQAGAVLRGTAGIPEPGPGKDTGIFRKTRMGQTDRQSCCPSGINDIIRGLSGTARLRRLESPRGTHAGSLLSKMLHNTLKNLCM